MNKLSENKVRRPLFWLQILIIAITLFAIAVVIFLGSQTRFETRRMALEQFNKQQLILARSTAAGIEVYFKELSAALSSLAKLPNVQLMTPECLQCMQHTYRSLPSRTSIRLLGRNGELRFIYPFDGWRGELIGRDYREEAYFKGTRETGQIIVSRLIINEQGETRIRITVPFYMTYKTKTVKVGDETGVIVVPIEPSSLESGRFQGILVGSFDPHTIAQEFVSPIVSGKTGYAWLLSEDSILIAHHEEEFVGRNAFEVRAEIDPEISYGAIEDIQQRMITGEEGVGRYISCLHRGQRGVIEKLIAY
ncbi:cache domain-containing protein, partial [candidate division WOR-3 bacterium]|nr:cache domain-containing protein [candidate division WOR-3 bacterium]